MIGIELLKSAALLLSLLFLVSFLLRVWPKTARKTRFASGVLFGAICVVGMAVPLQLAPGVIFDARSVILSVGAFWGGPLVGAITGSMAAAYRLWLGGAGAATGALNIGMAVLFGLVYWGLRKRFDVPVGPAAMLAFGVIVHGYVALSFYFLPVGLVGVPASTVALPVLVTFAPMTMLFGMLLTDLDRRIAVESALRESEVRFRDLTDCSADFYWEQDADGVMTFVSDTVAKALGSGPEVFASESFRKWTDFDNLGPGAAEALAAVDERRPFRNAEFRLNLPSGPKWVRVSANPMFGIDGSFGGYRGASTDITGQKREEKSRGRIEGILNSAQRLGAIGGWEWDVAKQEMFWTDEVYRIHDFIPGDIEPGTRQHIARSLECYRPEDRPRIMAAFEGCAAKGESYDLEFPFTTAKGRQIWIRTAAEAVREDGRIVKVVGNIQDITAQKKAEKAIKESEELFRQLFDKMADGVAIYRCVDDGQDFAFVDLNATGQSLSKVRLDEIIGRRVTEIFPAVREMGLLDVLRRVWRTGRPEHLPLREYRDGRIAEWVENYVYKIPSGLLVAIYSDVSERKRAESELRASEERHRTLIETMAEGVAEIDAGGTVTFASGRFLAMAGFRPDEIVGRPYEDFVDAEWRGTAGEHFMRLKAGLSKRLELLLRRKDGSELWTRISASPRLDESGTFVAATLLVTDLTLRHELDDRIRSLETQVAHASRVSQVAEMATALAHELNQPLATAAMYAQGIRDQLRRNTYEPTEIAGLADRIYGQIERASVSAKRIREFLRRREPATVRLDLNDLVRDTVLMLRPLAGQRNVGIAFRLAHTPCFVDGDPILLQQVLANLVQNGIEAMAGTSTNDRSVTLLTAVQGRRNVMIQVRDHGPGLTVEAHEHLFETFFTTKPQGLGLGLAICRTIVEGHGGHIHAYNHPDGGAVFEVLLPISEGPATDES